MSRWFRHYAGMMRDDKLVRVAIRSKQTIERVVWVWGAILESAAEIDDGGRYDVDSAELAYFLRSDQTDTDGILAGLADAGRIASGCVVNWGNRQFTSDRSKDRVAAYRERKRSENVRHNDIETSRAADVTLPKRHGDAPETEADTDTDKKEAVASATVSHRPDPFPVSEALDDWNQSAVQVGWATVVKFTPARKTALRNRLRDDGLDGWRIGIARARASPLLGGTDPPAWFDFDWIVKPGNFAKLIEGKYDKSFNTVATFPVANTRADDIDNARRKLGFG